MLAIDKLHLFNSSKISHICLAGMNDAPVATPWSY